MRMIISLYLFFVILFFTGCVTTPEKPFYDSKITTIEVNTIKYDKSKHRDEIDKLEIAVIEKLKAKGYHAFLGPRIINDEAYAGNAAKKLIPNSTADAFMIISPEIIKVEAYYNDTTGFITHKVYDPGFRNLKLKEQDGDYEPISNKYIGETLREFRAGYWIYNRSGDRILQSPTQFMMRKESTNERKTTIIAIYIDTRDNLKRVHYRFLETEDEFRSRFVSAFTDNIPNKQ